MKYSHFIVNSVNYESPSMRREWIEIPMFDDISDDEHNRLPPCGGSGLKSLRSLEEVQNLGLPPCGGSGLKYYDIEEKKQFALVSLHAEGVD